MNNSKLDSRKGVNSSMLCVPLHAFILLYIYRLSISHFHCPILYVIASYKRISAADGCKPISREFSQATVQTDFDKPAENVNWNIANSLISLQTQSILSLERTYRKWTLLGREQKETTQNSRARWTASFSHYFSFLFLNCTKINQYSMLGCFSFKVWALSQS